MRSLATKVHASPDCRIAVDSASRSHHKFFHNELARQVCTDTGISHANSLNKKIIKFRKRLLFSHDWGFAYPWERLDFPDAMKQIKKPILHAISEVPMHQPTKNGRPLNPRNEIAGRNLHLALKILGKTWRKNSQDTSHVLQWDNWNSYGLPRSPTTIDADIHRGIPEERLESYARCLGLTVMMLTSPDSDLHTLLDPLKSKTHHASSSIDLGYGPTFQEQYSIYNTQEYINNLFLLMNGVYTISYVTPILDIILRCSFCIPYAAQYHLCGQGLFYVYGLDNKVNANIFRWHNNLHAIFHCHNMMELGHYLVIDPLRHHLVARRNPFWLKGTGVTDNGQADNAPITFTFYMQKLELPAGQTILEFWESQCEALRKRPMILPDDVDYTELRAMIETPDSF